MCLDVCFVITFRAAHKDIAFITKNEMCSVSVECERENIVAANSVHVCEMLGRPKPICMLVHTHTNACALSLAHYTVVTYTSVAIATKSNMAARKCM